VKLRLGVYATIASHIGKWAVPIHAQKSFQALAQNHPLGVLMRMSSYNSKDRHISFWTSLRYGEARRTPPRTQQARMNLLWVHPGKLTHAFTALALATGAGSATLQR